MNVCGEWVGRAPKPLSLPRGETAPPTTLMLGFSAFRKSYVVASSFSYAGAARSCGCFYT
jgi:hypothetical protein